MRKWLSWDSAIMKYSKEKQPEKSLTRDSYVWNMTETLRADW